MKPVDPTIPDPSADRPALHRRKLLGAIGTTGALAAAAAVLTTRQAEPAAAQPEAGAAPERAAGYQLTEHVQRYYQTTRI
jgi:hypothetical protein